VFFLCFSLISLVSFSILSLSINFSHNSIPFFLISFFFYAMCIIFVAHCLLCSMHIVVFVQRMLFSLMCIVFFVANTSSSLLQAHHLLCYRCDVVVHIILFVVGASFFVLHWHHLLCCVLYIFFANCSKCNVVLWCRAHLFFCCMLSLVVYCKSIETIFYYRSSTYKSF
jgi:hypothetical protein